MEEYINDSSGVGGTSSKVSRSIYMSPSALCLFPFPTILNIYVDPNGTLIDTLTQPRFPVL